MGIRPPTPLTERQGRALVELVKRPEARVQDPVSLLAGVPLGELAGLACHHRLPGLAYRSLVELGVDGPELEVLRSAYQMAAMAHARCLAELASTDEALVGLPSPWLVVKGPVLVEIGYGDAGARLYEDLDLVVAAPDLSAALGLLEHFGGHVPDLNWALMARLRRAEIPMVLAGGMLCDLHWHLLVTANARARFALSMEELVERRRVIQVGTTAVATLDSVDGLIYLCLHGSLSGGHQLVWLKDLDQMIDSEPPDWDELVRRARLGHLDLVAAVQLARSRDVLGTGVPSSVIDALAGRSGWWRVWRRQEARQGTARWGGYDRTGRTFLAATSGGTLASAAQLGRSLVSDVAAPVWARHRVPGAGSEDAPPPLYRGSDHPEGSAVSRAEYLDLVTGGSWEPAPKRAGSPSNRVRQWSEQK